MTESILVIGAGAARRTIHLADYLSPDAEERAHADAYAWIKQLRRVQVDGEPFRARFRIRGDSLWWFTELYLHKERVILDIHRAIAATEALIERERPSRIEVANGSVVIRDVVPQVAALRQVECPHGRVPAVEWRGRLARVKWRARALTLAAFASRLRARSAPAVPPPAVAAFVHRAFWKTAVHDGDGEAYIGPVLKAIENRAGSHAVGYVGIGPSVNFRARRWWGSLAPAGRSQRVISVERYAPWTALRASRTVWRERHANFQRLSRSEELRAAARTGGIDCWALVREQLAGIAWLQWPWSVRAMDEAGAALDALRPAAVLTYAEAGGWGRALILEARRRGIPTAGLQHGFIYRQWLNYLHEPDEMEPDDGGDGGFPAPTVTLVFDEYAARHLRERGRFASGTIRVTGSPRLDALMQELTDMPAERVATARRDAGVAEGDALLLVTTKEREARHSLPALIAAAERMPGVVVVIKPHPAETEAAYSGLASGHPRVRVISPGAPLAPLMAASRALVTVNSTLALDAVVAGIPALIIGLPNNLSPFVEAGALAGARGVDEIPALLERILYDDGFRQQLASRRSAFLRDYAMASDGGAAARTAAAVLELAGRTDP